MKKILSFILILSLLFALGVPSFADSGSGAYEHVFIIGVDGGGAAFSQTETPCFDSIFSRFAYTHTAKTEYVTISAQNWGSILTGVDYNTHGFTNSIIEKNERSSQSGNNSVFYYARQAFPQAELVSFVNWKPINYGLIENDLGVSKFSFLNDDPGLTEAIESYFASGNAPKLMFVQLDNVDHMAHAHGGFSDEYYEAVRGADAMIGRIYNAIAAAGLMENSLFIVVADHGETAGGHGGQTPEESSVVLAAIGRNVRQMQLGENVRNRDVAAIALDALGIATPSHMTAQVPDILFGEVRDLSQIPGQVPEDEPETDPASEPSTEPDNGDGNDSGLNLWQKIVRFFLALFETILQWFGK